MKIITRLGAALALAASATPTIAAPAAPTPANPAASLSVARAPRAAAPVRGASRFLGQESSTLINIGILAALVAVVLVATKDDDSDSN